MSEYIRHKNKQWLISNLYALSNDVENEDIRKELYCLKCSLQFESRSVFDLHLKLLHKGENCSKVDNLAWKWCTKCEIGYQTQESFDLHFSSW